MEKRIMGIEDTYTGLIIEVNGWDEMAETAISRSAAANDYVRYLPYCNGWNLDYPQRDETVKEYAARMVNMAIGLQLI